MESGTNTWTPLPSPQAGAEFFAFESPGSCITAFLSVHNSADRKSTVQRKEPI